MIRIGLVRAHLSGAPPSAPRGIIYGLLLVAAPTVLRTLIDSMVFGLAFVTYFPFVLIAALFMSWSQAIAVILLSAVTANFLFMEPRFIFFATRTDTVGATFFVIAALMIVAVAQSLRRAVRELEQSRAREAHLNREMQHRVKNTLAVVQALATQTFRHVPEASTSLDKLQGRIRALADANEILSHGHWEECRLPDLAARALEPFNARGALKLSGPECILPEESCVPLVLALHELATNAVKYGALSSDKGVVRVRWDTLSNAVGGTELFLNWQELGGPPVSQPTRRGLGARLLRPQPGLEDVRLSFETDGVRCEIALKDVREVQRHEKRGSQNSSVLYSGESVAAAV